MQDQRQVESTTAPFNIHVHKITQVLVFRKHEVNLEPNFSFITVYLLSFLDIVWNLITNITLDISEFKKHIDRQKYKVPLH